MRGERPARSHPAWAMDRVYTKFIHLYTLQVYSLNSSEFAMLACRIRLERAGLRGRSLEPGALGAPLAGTSFMVCHG